MGVRILHDSEHGEACLFCSVVMKAFGPVFDADDNHEADDRVECFLHYLKKNNKPDPRRMDEKELDTAYSAWLKQEKEQWKETEPD